MTAVILAGGLGTRLRSVVSDRPKPMAEAGGRPFLEYLIDRLRQQGFRDVVLCVGHLHGQILSHFGDGQRWGVSIRYAVEERPLGTAGAIRNARAYADGPFLVLNGDSYLEVDLRSLIHCHRQQCLADSLAVGTLAAVALQDAAAYGTLELGEDHCVRSFMEKAVAAAGWVNGGVYVLEPEVPDWIPTGRPVSIEQETFPLLLASGRHLYACPVEGFFVDIGTPEGYARFQDHVRAMKSPRGTCADGDPAA